MKLRNGAVEKPPFMLLQVVVTQRRSGFQVAESLIDDHWQNAEQTARSCHMERFLACY